MNSMIFNYLKLSFRNIFKHKIFSAINIVGLAIGIAACLILAQYAFLQYNYDVYHQHHKNVYRVENELYVDGEFDTETILINYKLTNEIRENIPQVKKMARFGSIDYINNTMIYKSKEGIISNNESQVFVSDKELFDMMDFDFIEGSPEKFDEPNKVILTNEIARKYFKDEPAVLGSFEYEVIGVIEDLPDNTHLAFNMLLSFLSEKNYTGSEINRSYFTYVMLEEGTNPQDLFLVMGDLANKLYAKRFAGNGSELKFDLHPLNKIQLYYPQFPSFKKAGDLKTVNILIIVAIIILMIAWFNYINLSTVKAIERAKEIGIRKVLGSRKKHILIQFMIESVLINFIAALIAFTIVQISIPIMKAYLDFPVSLGLDLSAWLLIIAILVTELPSPTCDSKR